MNIGTSPGAAAQGDHPRQIRYLLPTRNFVTDGELIEHLPRTAVTIWRCWRNLPSAASLAMRSAQEWNKRVRVGGMTAQLWQSSRPWLRQASYSA